MLVISTESDRTPSSLTCLHGQTLSPLLWPRRVEPSPSRHPTPEGRVYLVLYDVSGPGKGRDPGRSADV